MYPGRQPESFRHWHPSLARTRRVCEVEVKQDVLPFTRLFFDHQFCFQHLLLVEAEEVSDWHVDIFRKILSRSMDVAQVSGNDGFEVVFNECDYPAFRSHGARCGNPEGVIPPEVHAVQVSIPRDT